MVDSIWFACKLSPKHIYGFGAISIYPIRIFKTIFMEAQGFILLLFVLFHGSFHGTLRIGEPASLHEGPKDPSYSLASKFSSIEKIFCSDKIAKVKEIIFKNHIFTGIQGPE